MIHAPVPSVTTGRVNPVSVCVAVTVTPGSTAPLSSVTRPASSAVACAQATPVMRKRVNPTTEKLRRQEGIYKSPHPRVNADYIVSTLVARILHPTDELCTSQVLWV